MLKDLVGLRRKNRKGYARNKACHFTEFYARPYASFQDSSVRMANEFQLSDNSDLLVVLA